MRSTDDLAGPNSLYRSQPLKVPSGNQWGEGKGLTRAMSARASRTDAAKAEVYGEMWREGGPSQ